jgi:hypothetical protein
VAGNYRRPKGRECELLHTPLRCTQENPTRGGIVRRDEALFGQGQPQDVIQAKP